MNVQKFYEAIAKIIAAREGVRIEVKSIKKVPEAGEQPGTNAERHLEQLKVYTIAWQKSRKAENMTIYEAFRNRGLLAPERFRPIYRVTYGNRYEKNTVTLQVGDKVTAKEQLQALWQQYAAEKHIPEDSVLDIHCVGNGDSTTA